jgi:hypothetical protein
MFHHSVRYHCCPSKQFDFLRACKEICRPSDEIMTFIPKQYGKCQIDEYYFNSAGVILSPALNHNILYTLSHN